MTNAEDVCRTAADLVGGDRAKTHGDKVENHANIARFWNAHLQVKYPPRHFDMPELTALDVAQMMALLKSARQCHGAFNLDDYVDQAGYAGVAGEIAARVENELIADILNAADKPAQQVEDDGFVTCHCTGVTEDPTAGEFGGCMADPDKPRFKVGQRVRSVQNEIEGEIVSVDVHEVFPYCVKLANGGYGSYYEHGLEAVDTAEDEPKEIVVGSKVKSLLTGRTGEVVRVNKGDFYLYIVRFKGESLTTPFKADHLELLS